MGRINGTGANRGMVGAVGGGVQEAFGGQTGGVGAVGI